MTYFTPLTNCSLQMKSILQNVGCFIVGQTEDLVPGGFAGRILLSPHSSPALLLRQPTAFCTASAM